MKYYIHTTGCKANQWDSYVVSEKMKEEGISAGPLQEADIVIINACTLTGGAEHDVRRFINLSRRENEKATVILTGCHGQVYPDRAFGADLVLGQSEKFSITQFLEKRGTFVSDMATFSLEKCSVSRLPHNKTRFFLKIQDGCNNFCSYCIVPYARGNPVSRPVDEVLEIMKSLKNKDVKEVVLTGIEISAYHDAGTGKDLKGLLMMLEKGDTPPRIRMSSIDPLHIDDGLMEIMAGSGKIMKSLHIPLQSGSDEILRSMGRRYTQAFMRDLIFKVTDRFPSAGIGLDVIVGFPGEDEKLFEETCRFIESLPIYYLHVFPFSPRAGTPAAAMTNAVSGKGKKERVHRLRNIDLAKREAFYKRFIGKEMWIIPEGKIYKEKYIRGYTDNYLPVHLPYEKKVENCLLRVTIEGTEGGILLGRKTED